MMMDLRRYKMTDKFTNGDFADYMMKKRNDKTREFWISFYNDYFGFKSNLNEFWQLVKETN